MKRNSFNVLFFIKKAKLLKTEKPPYMYRYTVRFNEEEHARFLSMFEKSSVYARYCRFYYKI